MQYFHLQMQVQNGFILIKMILRVGQRLRVTLEDRVSFLCCQAYYKKVRWTFFSEKNKS